MKHALTAAALSLAIAAGAGGAATAQVWQGDMFFTKTTATCNTDSDAVGDFGQAVFSPAATNGSTDELAFFSGRGSAMQLIPSTGTTLNGATSFTITAISHTAGAGQELKVKSGPLTVSPAVPTPANQTITVSGPVTNFANIKGCNVTMQGTLFLRPGN